MLLSTHSSLADNDSSAAQRTTPKVRRGSLAHPFSQRTLSDLAVGESGIFEDVTHKRLARRVLLLFSLYGLDEKAELKVVFRGSGGVVDIAHNGLCLRVPAFCARGILVETPGR